eukprot:TRINITY_DN6004_c0_g1_i3.p1 TRINITY_DN6004_c0_g1~~TRINITY_DN6004_c0_g1_i3.p1  ORF type:complete len:357 (-),score=45.20 TRINITY_DN6004_c0_g1_i3:67-1086(-)
MAAVGSQTLIWFSFALGLVCEAILFEHSSRRSGCDDLPFTSCSETRTCKWFGGKCSPQLAWLHIPKTGSSFGTTLAHTANSSLPQRAHIPSGTNKSDPEDVIVTKEDLVSQHLVLDFFKHKYPVDVWFNGVFRNPINPGDHIPIRENEEAEWRGLWVGMFRQPEERVSSAWHNFALGKGDMFAFQRIVAGQQTSMLSLGVSGRAKIDCETQGGGQNGPAPACETARTLVPNVRLALKRLNEFNFIGLTEEWDFSICLFHVLYKSDCLSVEFENIRPTEYHESERQQELDIKRLKENPDPYDTIIYKAAVSAFQELKSKYDISNETCRKVCPGGPFGQAI